MKRIICGALAAMMVLGCSACSNGKDYSEYGDTAVVELENVKAKAGNEVELEVYLNNNPGTASVGLELHYDEEVLTPVSMKASGELAGQGFFSSNLDEEDTFDQFEDDLSYVKAVWFNAFNFTGNGEIMTVKFEVAEDAPAGEYPITVTVGEGDLVSVTENGSNPDDVTYANVPVTNIDGSVTVS